MKKAILFLEVFHGKLFKLYVAAKCVRATFTPKNSLMVIAPYSAPK